MEEHYVGPAAAAEQTLLCGEEKGEEAAAGDVTLVDLDVEGDEEENEKVKEGEEVKNADEEELNDEEAEAATEEEKEEKEEDGFNLPDDIILRIFALFSPRELAIVALVHRKWNKLSCSDELWKNFFSKSQHVRHRSTTWVLRKVQQPNNNKQQTQQKKGSPAYIRKTNLPALKQKTGGIALPLKGSLIVSGGRRVEVDSWKLFYRMTWKRTKIAREIYNSEKAYVNNLRTVVEFFIKPLKLAGPVLLSNANRKALFSEWEVILGYQSELLHDLEERMAEWSFDQCLGDIFKRMVSFMKVYTSYVNQYDKAIMLLAKLKAQKEDFRAYIHYLERRRECNRNNLNSFLIMPVQRIPRYVLLLRDLVSNTYVEHPDWEDLNHALEKMKELTGYIDQKKEESDRIQQLIAVQETLFGYYEPIVVPGRHLRQQGKLVVVSAIPARRPTQLVTTSTHRLLASAHRNPSTPFHTPGSSSSASAPSLSATPGSSSSPSGSSLSSSSASSPALTSSASPKIIKSTSSPSFFSSGTVGLKKKSFRRSRLPAKDDINMSASSPPQHHQRNKNFGADIQHETVLQCFLFTDMLIIAQQRANGKTKHLTNTLGGTLKKKFKAWKRGSAVFSTFSAPSPSSSAAVPFASSAPTSSFLSPTSPRRNEDNPSSADNGAHTVNNSAADAYQWLETIPLTAKTLIVEDHGNAGNGFQLITEEKAYHFRGLDKQEEDQWVTSLRVLTQTIQHACDGTNTVLRNKRFHPRQNQDGNPMGRTILPAGAGSVLCASSASSTAAFLTHYSSSSSSATASSPFVFSPAVPSAILERKKTEIPTSTAFPSTFSSITTSSSSSSGSSSSSSSSTLRTLPVIEIESNTSSDPASQSSSSPSPVSPSSSSSSSLSTDALPSPKSASAIIIKKLASDINTVTRKRTLSRSRSLSDFQNHIQH
ncbi:RhoGEF domain containing protein [Balamuthia mandrillaris]